ncbi:MAG: hypothetical protein ABIC96_01660 [Patescibacteria group bacterium]
MSEEVDLASFIPEDKMGIAPIELREELMPVVGRISQVLPPDKVWEFFSSAPNETGRRIVFPYYRVDKTLEMCQGYIWLLTHDKQEQDKFLEYYRKASRSAFHTLVWVEVGFQGLESLAKNPASRNWTMVVGHFVNDEERAKGIVTEGAKYYRECLQEFVDFRTQQGITSDYFSEYGVEYLLNKVK